MNWLPSFGAWQFAAAGGVGAVATILIHLLNRRRYQTLEWGAVEFLRQAIKRQRRVVQLRDAILLALRTLAVLLFGMALARPHFSHGEPLAGLRPVHAIVVIDNSLSMAYRTLDGTLLHQAKQSAAKLLERLPVGSRVSILPACGDDLLAAREPLADWREAGEAIEQIEVADTAASVREILARVRAAADLETNLPPRIVVLTDQQKATWNDAPTADDVGQLDQLQLVDFAPRQRDNTWIAELGVRDGFAEARTKSTVQAVVQRSGGDSVRHAEVSLLVDEQLIGSKSIVLQAGESSQLVTFEHVFVTSGARGLDYVPIKAVITPDRLTIDDTLYCLVPVAARLPIVFVDQYGPKEEDVRRGRLGETRALRRLLQSDREDDLREVAAGPRHLKFDELEPAAIEEARLVVVAGVESPQGKVAVLRRFVEDGGQLLIAAGGEFSAAKWHEYAWLDGNGILPAPLTGNVRGRSLRERTDSVRGANGHVEDGTDLPPALLSFDSLRHSRWLRLPGVSDEALHGLYAEALFFKWIEVDTTPAYASVYRTAARLETAERPPFLVERDVQQGRVLLLSTSVTSEWNTLAKSNAVVMLDRLARELVRSTITDRNMTTRWAIDVELPGTAHDAMVMLQRPDRGVADRLEYGYFDRERFGVTIRDAYRRGIYKLAAVPNSEVGVGPAVDPRWNMELAINGENDESDLTAANEANVAALAQHASISLSLSSDDISLADTAPVIHGLWWWFTLLVLGLLLAETLALVMTHRRRRVIRKAEWAT